MNPTQWKRPFLHLQQNIAPLISVGHQLFHSNVCLPFHDRKNASEFASHLEAAHRAEELAGIVETPTSGCRFHGHFFFGSSAIFQKVGTLLKDLHSWIDDIPEGLLPAFLLPRTERQTTHNLALWSNILLVLAWSQSKRHFAADVEFQQQLDQIEFSTWEELNQPPHLDPIAVLTHQKEIAVPFTEWSQRFRDNGLAVPEYFGTYLRDAGEQICGDFLKASMSAIDIIVYMLADGALQSSAQGSTRKPPGRRQDLGSISPARSRRAKPREDELFSDDATELLQWLLRHHGCATGVPKCPAFKSQTQVAREITARGTPFTQTRVSNSLRELMSKIPVKQQVMNEKQKLDGTRTYENLCDSETICEVLNGLDVRSNRYLEKSLNRIKELPMEHFDDFSDRGF